MTTATEPREDIAKPAARPALHLALAAMGTRFELVLPRTDRNPVERDLLAAGEAALAEIEQAHRRYSMHSRDSIVARINREAPIAPVAVDGEAVALLSLCTRVWQQSDGAFDPTAASPSLAGWSAVELDADRRTVFFHAPDLAIDLGGIAKGFAIDLAAEVLDDAGVRDALLHGGGSSILALGTPGGEHHGWPIHLDDHQRDTITLSDETFAMAERHTRHANDARRARQHITTHAREGAAATIDRALCILPSGGAKLPAATCDAWATALVAAGQMINRTPHGARTAFATLAGWHWVSDGKPSSFMDLTEAATTESRR